MPSAEEWKNSLNPEKLLTASFDAIQDGISVLGPDLEILRVNKIIEKWFAHAIPLVGKKCYEVYQNRTNPCEKCPSLRALRSGKQATEEMPLVQEGRQTGRIKLFAHPLKDDQGSVNGVVVFVRNVRAHQDEINQQQGIEENEQRAIRQRSALALLSVDPDIAGGNMIRACRTLLATAAEALVVERASIWLFSEDGLELCCFLLYERSRKNFGAGPALNIKDYPRYFEAISRDGRITAADARSDPRTSEIKEVYLEPLGINSMLDAGIFLAGQLAGVICFEHTGSIREWHTDEQSFADTMAGMYGQVAAQIKRLETEKELQDERAQLISIFNSINEAIYVADPYNHEIVFANAFLRKMYAKKLEGEKCYHALQGLDAPCAFCTNQIILENKDVPYQWEHYNAALDKTFLIIDRIIKWPDGRDVRFEMAIDITTRKRAEQSLLRGREWYRTIAEDIPVLIIRISADGLITYVNDASSAIMGSPRRKIIGDVFFNYIPAKQQLTVKNAFAALTPQNPVITYEYTHRFSWFRWKTRAIFDEKERLIEYLTVGEDITEQKAVAEKLKESEERSRAMIEAIPDMLFRFNEKGRCLDAQVKDLKLLFGQNRQLYLEGRLIGKKIKEVLPPDIADLLLEGIGTAIKTGQTRLIEFSYAPEPEMEKRNFEARLVSTATNEVISIVRDTTDWKEAEAALRYQFSFEKMVADISSTFVNTPNDRVDEAINHALRLSGEFFSTDRSYVCRFSADGLTMDNTHEWCAAGVESMQARNRGFLLENTPWWAEQLHKGNYVYVPDVDSLPPEAVKDKIDFQLEGTRSFLTIPFFKNDQVIGFFGFKAVREKEPLSEQQIALLKVVAEIIGEAIIKNEAEEALKESERRYRDILDTMEEAYYEADLAGNIIFFNNAGLLLYGGYTAEEAYGISYKKIYKDPQEAFKTFHRVFLTGEPDKGLVLEMIRRDGSTFFAEISISLTKDKNGRVTGFKGIGKDVTDRIRYEQRLEYLSMHDQLTGIYNRTFFEAELSRFEESRDYPVTIISADLDGLKLVNDTMGHDTGDRLLVGCAEVLKKSIRRSDILARVGGDEFSIILPATGKTTAENVVRRIRQNISEYNRRHRDLPLGISIGVATTANHKESLKQLFKKADDMMYRDKLYRSGSSRGKIVQSLLAALAERDYITEGHARRLEELCRAVGEEINLSSRQLSDLALLAQVHDLGKVGIPDHILFKPGPLTAAEWEIMRGHPEKGYRIASSSADLSGVAELILKHHERWDGSGYPLGLKKTEIPVECRILSIVDAYDAMTNKRPYNRTRSAAEALKELEDNAGSQFDPHLVPVFIAIIREGDK